jgi:signal transduction histidine kinase
MRIGNTSIYYRTVIRSTLKYWTAIIICSGFLSFAAADPAALVNHRAPVANAILDTSVAIIGTMVAFLVVGRFRRSERVGDLMIVSAILLLSWVHTIIDTLPNLVVPHLISHTLSTRTEFWGSNVTRVLAAGYLFLATLPCFEQKHLKRTWWKSLPMFVVPAIIGLTGMTLLIFMVPVNSEGLLHGLPLHETLAPSLQIGGAVMLFVACLRLAEESGRNSDAFMGWIGTGGIFAGFAMISSALFTSHGSDWLQPSDVLRGAAVITWAWGAAAEIRYYWATVADAAKVEARRSVALDLHDGIAQELALLTTYLTAPPEVRLTSEWHRQAQATAERALAETRRTITTLADNIPRPIETDLLRTADFASGIGVDVNIEVGASSTAFFADSARREAIVRIVREAVSNAVRHGHAASVDILISEAEGSPLLRVSDDGLGFDPDAVVDSGHYGLISMRERAEVIGASLAVQSKPGEGTTVEVLWL